MKKILLHIIPMALCPLFLMSQAPDTAWTRTYGGLNNDVGYAVLQMSDGGYIIVGSTESFGAGGKDGYIIRTDAYGDTLWTRCCGGSEDDELLDIAQTLDGNYIGVGYSDRLGSRDIWIVEIDTLGNAADDFFGGSGDEEGWSIQSTPENEFIITGYAPCGFLDNAVLLLKIRKSYNTWLVVWMKLFYRYQGSLCGYIGNNVIQTFDAGIIVAADAWTPDGIGEAWIIKTDFLGEVLWDRTFDYYHVHGGLTGVRIVEALNGYAAIGSKECGPGGPGVFVLKMDTWGDTLWGKIVVPMDWSSWIYCRSSEATEDRGFIITGFMYADTLGMDIPFIKADVNGNTSWTTIFGGIGNQMGYSTQQTSDFGYIIAGSTDSHGAGGDDVYLIKLGPDVGVEENHVINPPTKNNTACPSIFSGPIQLPQNRACRVFDITGRVVIPQNIKPGIYFIEIEGKITQKVVRVR